MNNLLNRLSDPWQRLSAARLQAYEKMPYFRAGIQSLVPRMVEGLGTLGVTKENILLVDPEVLGQWTGPEAGWVVLHEYLHRFLRHAERWEALCKAGVAVESDRSTWGQATDCEINDNLIEAGASLPSINGGKPITPGLLGVQPHQMAEAYFHELKKRQQNQPPSPQQKPGWGREGSGMGNPVPNEPKGDPDARTESDQQIQRRQDAENIRSHQKRNLGRGTVPAGLALIADALLEPPKVRWQDKFTRAVRRAVEFVAGQGDYTWDRRSHIQPALDVCFGEESPVLPGEHQPRAEVAFVVDTSGSMGQEQRAAACSEAAEILKHMGGARVTFVAIDAAVHVCRRVRSVQEILRNLKGGGGTDFRPAFETLKRAKPRPDIVVFATDGYGPAPTAPPDGMHVIWLVIDGEKPCDWGELIELDTGSGQ